MTIREIIWWWVVAYAATVTATAARLGLQLSTGDPPDDPAELRRWNRRRRWLIAAELSAGPMFATLAVAAAAEGWCSPVMATIGALLAGALGFAFFSHGLEVLARRRLNLEQKA